MPDWTDDPLLKEAIETGSAKKALEFLDRLEATNQRLIEEATKEARTHAQRK